MCLLGFMVCRVHVCPDDMGRFELLKLHDEPKKTVYLGQSSPQRDRRDEGQRKKMVLLFGCCSLRVPVLSMHHRRHGCALRSYAMKLEYAKPGTESVTYSHVRIVSNIDTIWTEPKVSPSAPLAHFCDSYNSAS